MLAAFATLALLPAVPLADGDEVVAILWVALVVLGLIYTGFKKLLKAIAGAGTRGFGAETAAERPRAVDGLGRSNVAARRARALAGAGRSAPAETSDEDDEADDDEDKGDSDDEVERDATAARAYDLASDGPRPPTPARITSATPSASGAASRGRTGAALPVLGSPAPPEREPGEIIPRELAARLTEAQQLFLGSEVFERPRQLRPPRR